MPSRWAVVGTLLVVAACTDSTGPDPVVDTIVLDFCSDRTPLWFAYQNAGGDWTRVLPSAGGAFEFDASERVAVAFTIEDDDGLLTDVYYTTATELAPISGRACIERSGAKVINGSVADVLTGEEAVISIGAAEDTVTPPPSTFSLAGVPEGPQDVVAHREAATVNGSIPDRVIIRRAQSLTNGATMTVLDFSTTPSEATAVNTATISGLAIGETNLLDVYFHTALGTDHTLYLAPFFSTSSQTIYGVPSTLTQAGDLHELVLDAEASSGDYRTVKRWYRTPANQALALGPALNTPQFSGIAANPYLRMRAQVASQSDYPSFATAYFIQGAAPSQRAVFVTVTAGYNNGTRPSVWTLEIPDVTEAGGYPGGAALVSGQGTLTFVEAYDGALTDVIGTSPSDGSSVRWAGYVSDVTLLRAEGSETGRTNRRPDIINDRVYSRRR